MTVMAATTSASASGGNSGAAQQCQQGGYVNLQRSDGSSFKNAGDCVSYFAQGGTAAACNYTPGATGCMIFDNVTLPSGDGTETMTLTGAFLFSTTACNSVPPLLNQPCVAVPNNLATGGGSYTITDNASGATVDTGTVSADATTGSYEGLVGSYFTAADGTTLESCSAAADRTVSLIASTSSQAQTGFEIYAGTEADGAFAVVIPVGGGTETFGAGPIALTIAC